MHLNWKKIQSLPKPGNIYSRRDHKKKKKKKKKKSSQFPKKKKRKEKKISWPNNKKKKKKKLKKKKNKKKKKKKKKKVPNLEKIDNGKKHRLVRLPKITENLSCLREIKLVIYTF